MISSFVAFLHVIVFELLGVVDVVEEKKLVGFHIRTRFQKKIRAIFREHVQP